MKKNFIDIADFSQQQLQSMIDTALLYKQQKSVPDFTNRICSLLFLENSTRTLNSFQVACNKLNIFPLYAPAASSSMAKGESLLDTVATLAALGAQAVVVRDKNDVACHSLREELGDKISIVNAGSGMLHHPTQALLDLVTIYEKFGRLTNLKIAIVGDIKHSRVAHSLVSALHIVGDNEVRLVAPEELQADTINTAQQIYSLQDGIADVDIIYLLRVQRERFDAASALSNYATAWQLNSSTLGAAANAAMIMHPGPFNRGLEIGDELVNCAKSYIWQQVANGVYARMSVLSYVL